MKKIFYLSVFLVLYTSYAGAQSLAINTDGSTANASALLDVKSTAKGMLIPRMSKTEKNAIAAPATGLLIFQNAPDSIGFYYYSGSTWLWLANTAQQDTLAWRTKGNTGTTVANHFFGTTDNIPLSFRQNNLWMGRWNSTASNYFIGDSAGISITSGVRNVAMGSGALQKSTTSFGNVAIGNHTLQNNTVGRRNTAIGDSALFEQSYSTTLSTDNTAIGNSAMRSNNPTTTSNGIKNVAVGNDALYQNTTGSENVAVGVSALRENLTGEGNTAVGRSANRLAKSGNVNSYIGYAAGYTDSVGSYNTAVGGFALYLHETGNYNTAIGSSALEQDSSGNRNTAIGFFASGRNDTATRNTSVGYYALGDNKRSYITAVGAYAGRYNGHEGTNIDGIENTMIGYGAMTGNTLGSQNTAVGYKAMAITEPNFYVSNIFPSRNVAIGDSAMRRNLGNDNVGVGFRVLGSSTSNASSTANTAIGSNAMFGNISGTGNVAMGYLALNESEASSYNVAIGNAAMLNHKLTGAAYNTAVGASALQEDSSGFQNTAVGVSSFRSNKQSPYNSGLGVNSGYYQKGSDNTFVGAYAGFGQRINAANVVLDIGIKNTGLGAGALYRLANGNYNVALGQDALLYDSSGSYNVAVGHNSLPAITSGTYNVALGYNTNVSAATLTNTITIGANAYAAQSNSLILGSINGVNGATASVNVGIGTSAPDVRLQVNGAFATTSQSFTLTGIATTVTVTPGNISFLKIDNSTAVNKIISLADGLADGQRLTVLVRNTSTGTVNFTDNAALYNTNLSGSFLMNDNDTITLIWDETAAYWVETGRSDN